MGQSTALASEPAVRGEVAAEAPAEPRPEDRRRAVALGSLVVLAIVLDALPSLFSILGAGFLVGRRPRAAPAGLLLGVAMALKPFPILLVPLFLRAPGLSLRARALVGALALGVVGAVTAPYLLADAAAV